MKLKCISTLEFYLTKWLHDHGFPGVKARVAADFQYDNDEETIYFALAVADEQDKKFLKFAQDKLDFPYDCDNFILSFFHELGHWATWYCWNENDWEDYFHDKELIAERKLPIEDYFSLPIEETATRWAIKQICTSPKEIEEFWRVCQKLLMNIYKQNGVVDE